MSNGRRDGHYGSFSTYASYQQSGQQQQQQQQDRRGSFEQGDDMNLGGNGTSHQQATYQAYGQNQYPSQSPSLNTQMYGAYAGPPQPYAPSPSTYNPANYAAQSPQMNASPIQPPTHIQMPAGNYAAAVPYNPASYSSTSPQLQQPGFNYNAYGSPPLSSYSHNSQPPLPPKPPELMQPLSSVYSTAMPTRRGVGTAPPADNQAPYPAQSPNLGYQAYAPPAPPAPPAHGPTATSPVSNQYQPYSPPILQGQQAAAAAAPTAHRRLPSIPAPQNATVGTGQSSQGWGVRVPGASLPANTLPANPRAGRTGHGRSSSSASTTARPLPAVPGINASAAPVQSQPSARLNGHSHSGSVTYDAIFAEVEDAVMGRPASGAQNANPPVGHSSRPSVNGVTGLFATQSSAYEYASDPNRIRTDADGEGEEIQIGLNNMRIQEQDEASVARNTSYRSTATTAVPPPGSDVSRNTSHRSNFSVNTFDTSTTVGPGLADAEQDDDSDDGIIPMDISMGFDPGMNFSYGGGSLSPPSVVTPPVHQTTSPPPPLPPIHTSNPSISSANGSQTVSGNGPIRSDSVGNIAQQSAVRYVWAHSGEDLVSPRSMARVDTGATGGLTEPNARRLSFDEDDEAPLMGQDPQEQSSSSNSSRGGSGIKRTASRPLPPPPEDDDRLSPKTIDAKNRDDQYDSSGEAPDVRKANSLNYANNNHHMVPGRSQTDAETRRKAAGIRSSYYVDAREPAFSSPGELELPAIPDGRRRKKFTPSKLSSKDYALCEEPWAISSIQSWLIEMTDGESDLKRQLIIDALVGLFTHKVPTMNIADAEVLGASIVQEMIHEAALVKEEEWIKFSGVKMTGVIYQLTGTGCYSSRVHTTTMQGRCYSHHCMRTLKKIDLQAQQLPPERKTEDWVTFYGIKVEEVKTFDQKEVELQFNLHEIVTSEDYFMEQLDVLLVLYRDGLAHSAQPIIALTGKQGKFIAEVFDKVPAVKKANEEHLLAQLKYRQQEQGPWVKGFSDIFREWIRRAKSAYVEYAYNLPNAINQVKTQSEQNPLFKQFLDQVREQPRSKRLDWNTYLKAPITRLQRYGLLLETVKKNMRKDSHAKEKANLEIAIKEIKEVTLVCDQKVAEMTQRTEMLELSTKLKLRPSMQDVQLNLNHLGRQIIHRGDLLRRGNNSMSWVESHVVLFDHFMILSKPTRTKDAAGAIKSEYYDVSKLPIPMDLLVLESADDGMVTKHQIKGIIPIGTTQVAPAKVPAGNELRLQRTTTGSTSASTPTTVRSNSSPAITSPSTAAVPENENIMFPFRVQHLGKAEVYVLFAPSAKARQEWVDNIILAKKNHANSLHTQNAEPFKLRVLADTAFAYSMDSTGGLPVHIPGTPLDRALRDIEREHPLSAQIQPVCRSPVNCAATFTPHLGDRAMLAVGTDFGVFMTDDRSPRSWYKVINATHVSQIQVLEDFNVLLIIADKSLIAFHLDAVVPTPGQSQTDNVAKKTPQKLSGSRDVGFFAVGRMKERMLVFYKKRDGISSTFKVLEPVYHKSATASSSSSSWGRSRFGLKKGNTEFFRDFDDFYIASDTYAINLFASSLAIASAKGIEVLTLDKKVPFSIPDLRAQTVQTIAQRLQGQRPLGMFRLSDQEFLLVFEELGIYVDKHGDVSRGVVMGFVGRARQAALYKGCYLVLVDATSTFVEIRNADNGRLRQVVSGRDVRMLDDGMAAGASATAPAGVNSAPAGTSRGAIKISMQHPELEKHYVIFELVHNENIHD